MTDRPRTLGAILYPDFELLDLYGPLEMFGSLGPDLLRIVTVAEQAGPVASAQGPETLARFDFASAPPLDLLLLPGGIGTLPQLGNAAMHEFLRSRATTAWRRSLRPRHAKWSIPSGGCRCGPGTGLLWKATSPTFATIRPNGPRRVR